MSDTIHILPHHIANQIAAGEVIQRPASVVKELLENAVDAGATQITLHIKDSGKTLISVIDNGKGMSFADAKTAFLRHATSKISKFEDLFSLYTKGFRGEALASIVAVAQCDLLTKMEDNPLGTHVYAENSEVKIHEETACSEGTAFYIKNLFFNVPARRNFLKSDKIENDHIHEEFVRVALVHPQIGFQYFADDKQVYHLPPSNFKQRIVGIFGNSFKDKLYAVEQDTDIIRIKGFITKPESAKKRKNDQYLFVNGRCVKHPNMNYAIETAFKQLIPEGYKPAYFIQLETDPKTIDINISPTKTDIKFQDERLIFGFLNSTVKKTLGSICLVPIIDFESDTTLRVDIIDHKEVDIPTIGIHPDYNPFSNPNPKKYDSSYTSQPKKLTPNHDWESFLDAVYETPVTYQPKPPCLDLPEEDEISDFIRLFDEFIIVNKSRAVILIHQTSAFERVFYERFLNALTDCPLPSQQSLFPETLQFTPADAGLLESLLPDFLRCGYDLVKQSASCFALNGVPMGEENESHLEKILDILEDYRSQTLQDQSAGQRTLALSFAKRQSKSAKRQLQKQEVQQLLKDLFACEAATVSPSGKKIVQYINSDSIKKLFD